MSQDRKRVAVEGDKEDRISDLPREVIDCILKPLPARNAARTSILSKKWRNVWSMLPYLVLDQRFYDGLKEKSKSFFIQTVTEILLLHRGDIVQFVLSAPESLLLPSTSIDRWMFYVTRNGIKELALHMRYKNDTLYTLPSYVFTCTTLTCLRLSNCVFKPPNSFLCFPKLETLLLVGITFAPTTVFYVLNAPCLVELDMALCRGAQYLNIVSPLLQSLYLCGSHYLGLKNFMSCKKMRVLTLSLIKVVENDERSTLEQLLFSLAPTLEKLYSGSFFLELLSADRTPKGPLFMFNCLWYLSLKVDFNKLSETSGALELIKSAPNLSKLEILVNAACDNYTAAFQKYLNTPSCFDRPLNELKHVLIRGFRASKNELIFIKLLLSHTPSLVRMTIDLTRSLSYREERHMITTKLVNFPRASPKAKLSFL